MVDGDLSGALVTYVWGLGGRSWPSRDVEAVKDRYGDQALNLIPRIRAIFAAVDAAEVNWSSEGLLGAVSRIKALIRSTYPELNEDAIEAIGVEFSYTWR